MIGRIEEKEPAAQSKQFDKYFINKKQKRK